MNFLEESEEVSEMREAFRRNVSELAESKGINSSLFTPHKYEQLIAEVREATSRSQRGGGKKAKDYRRLHRFSVVHQENLDGFREILVATSDDGSLGEPKYYVHTEQMFDIIHDAHLRLSHGGRNRILRLLQSKYKNIGKQAVELYLALCQYCRLNKRRTFLWSNVSRVEVVQSNKGRHKLIHMGFIYTQHKAVGEKVRWRCVQRACRCRGSIFTTTALTDPRPTVAHNHPPDTKAADHARRTMLIQRIAVSCPDDSLIQSQDFLVPIKSEPADPVPSTSDSQHSFQSPRTSARRQLDWNIGQVPQQVPQSGGNQQQKSAAPQMPILKKAPMQQQTVMPSSQQQTKLQSMKQVRGVSPPHQPPPPPPPPAVVAPPEVCLRWNSYHSNMQATFPNLLTNEQFVDVTLACEGRSIKCHKVILSACSAYFEELLSANPCQHPIVLMKDLRYWEVQALVDFMYRGEVNVGQDKLPSLLAAAEALQIKGLAGPASTSSSHDEDSLPPPMTPSSLEDFLDESVPSPSSARRARKRRMMSALQSQTQQSPASSSMAPLRLRQQPRSSAPVPSTSGYRHESAPDEPPPLRRARRSEAPMEIKIEPIDIDESNDSIVDADEVYDGKKFNTVPQHDGHDNGQNLSPEQKPHLDVSNQNDFSGTSSSNNMLSHSDLHSYPFEPGSMKDTANKRISDAGYVDDPMNPGASSSDHNVLAESGVSEESILGRV